MFTHFQKNGQTPLPVEPHPGPELNLCLWRGMSPDWLTSIISFTYSLQLFKDGKMEILEKIVEKYPCAFPRWIGPFQAFLYIYDPDYAKTFLSRTGKKRDDSQGPNPPRSDMTQPTGRLLKEF